MLPSRILKQNSISEGIEDTFNGKAPCPLCQLAAKKSEQEENGKTSIHDSKKKIQLSALPVDEQVDFGSPATIKVSLNFSSPPILSSRSEAPDVPPPELCS